ncbi:MAG: efflux RND transporter periplasmic adaptor subunit, partial [Bacteroidetes bacterium]|nr:efflux RND transporter periplasmic adaptor subunit [Bacteroidota bacterium]
RKEITEIKIEIAKNDPAQMDRGKVVAIVALGLSSFNHSIDIQGKVEADESVTISPTFPGLVTSVFVTSGDRVKAGQVLAQIDISPMKQQLEALKLQRDLLEDIYNRQKKLWDLKIGTEIQFLQSKTQYEATEKQVTGLQLQISMASLKAPMDGVVDAVHMKAGEIAVAGFSSIVVVNTSKLRVKAEVSEGYVTKVRNGNPVTLVFPDANKTLNSKISYAGRIINNLNRTFNVEVALASNEPDVVPNMIVIVKINDYTNDSAIVIPMSAIQQNSEGKTFVFIADKNKDGKLIAKKQSVSYTNSYNGLVEISAGLNSGSQLITDGSSDLNEGDIVSAK